MNNVFTPFLPFSAKFNTSHKPQICLTRWSSSLNKCVSLIRCLAEHQMSLRDPKQDQRFPFALSPAPPGVSAQLASQHRALGRRLELPPGTLRHGRVWDLLLPARGAWAAELNRCDVYSKDQGRGEHSR